MTLAIQNPTLRLWGDWKVNADWAFYWSGQSLLYVHCEPVAPAPPRSSSFRSSVISSIAGNLQSNNTIALQMSHHRSICLLAKHFSNYFPNSHPSQSTILCLQINVICTGHSVIVVGGETHDIRAPGVHSSNLGKLWILWAALGER